MKIIGIDLGDKWVGIAISDGAQITCRPYKTATITSIETELQTLLLQERIELIVIGLPRTMRGTESDQTTKVRLQAEELIEKLKTTLQKDIPYILWDERLSSRRAQTVMHEKNTSRKPSASTKEHAIAAAFILQTYLDGQAFKRNSNENCSS
jgi:putative holliday junction resolvase